VKEFKQEYIEAISTLMQECEDIALLDLIYQLLVKSRPKKDGKE
jgi:hypothetical protein